MLLAIDTATRRASLALYDGSGVISEFSWRCAGSHTVEVLPNIALMLEQAQKRASDLRAVAVARGPGSFTGLRIGMGVAKGLCLAVGIPIIAILPRRLWPMPQASYTVLNWAAAGSRSAPISMKMVSPLWYRKTPSTMGKRAADASNPILVTGEVGTGLAERLQRFPRLKISLSRRCFIDQGGYVNLPGCV